MTVVRVSCAKEFHKLLLGRTPIMKHCPGHEFLLSTLAYYYLSTVEGVKPGSTISSRASLFQFERSWWLDLFRIIFRVFDVVKKGDLPKVTQGSIS